MANFPRGVVSQPDRTRSGSCRDLSVLTGSQLIETLLEDNSPITEGSLRNWASRPGGQVRRGRLAARRPGGARLAGGLGYAATSRPGQARAPGGLVGRGWWRSAEAGRPGWPGVAA